MHSKKLLPLFAISISLMAIQPTQAATILFNLEGKAGSGLLPGNEVGSPTSTGSGGILTGISFDTVSSLLSISVGWGSGIGFTDLTGVVTAMHIHGPADVNSNAGVLYGLNGLGGFNSSATNGGFNGSLTIGAADVADLQNGLLYFNVHTAANGAGELRANLVQVPEPSSLALLGLASLATITRRRR